MKKHLKGEHGQVSREVESKVKRKKEEKSREQADSAAKKQRLGIGTWKRKDDVPKSQPSIKKSFANLQKYEADGAIQKAYDDALVELLSCNLLSFNLVDSPEFHAFVKLLDRNINLKSRRTYSRYTEKYSEEILQEVLKLIKEYTDAGVSVTADIWTSRRQDSYLSLSCHFIDKLFRIHRWTPAVALFNQSHTGENIQLALENLVENKLGIALDSLPLFATTDNAANMLRGVRLSMLEVYGCVCHWQQLAILDTFKEFRSEEVYYTMENISSKCKELASNIHHGTVGKMLLAEECKHTGHAPKTIHQANDTRWDTRHQNMSDVLYHEQCLLSLAAQGKLRVKKKGEPAYSLVPSPEEFRMMRGGVMVLQHCKTFTKIMEQEVVPTIPLVTQSLYDMEQEMKALVDNRDTDEVAREFCVMLQDKLFVDRFPEYGTQNDLNAFGNYLNPSCQGIHLKLMKKFEDTKKKLEEKHKEWSELETTEEILENNDDVQLPKNLSPTELLKKQLAGNINRRGRGGRDVHVEKETHLQREMREYELLPGAEQGVDQLNWWRIHQEQFPLLSHLVRVVFSVQAASSKSERIFSEAGQVLTPKRNRMSPEKLEDLLIIKLNITLLKEMGKWRKN